MSPRCLILFETACKSTRTFKTYKFGLDKFLEWCHKDYESLTMTPIKDLEDLLRDYCIFLRARVTSNEISPNSIQTYFNPIWRFLKVNRIKVDKESIIQLFPDKVKLGGHDAISTEQLVKLLNACDTLRDRAIVHFFAATGARLEAVCELKLENISEYDSDFYKIVLYSEDYKHEMTTFLYSESVNALKEYFAERESHGEKLTSESFVFAVNGYWKSKSKPMSYNVLENMFDRLWKRSGIKRIKKGNRYNLASTTSIRKRFDTILEMNYEVSSGASQYLMDHTGYLSGIHYRRPTEEQIFKSYHAVSSELMISNELRMELQLKQKEDEDEHGFCDYCHCMLVDFEYVGMDKPPDFEFVGLVNGKDWKAKETLEEAVDRKKFMGIKIKNRYKNPRKNYINDGQGIGSDYARFLRRLEN